MTNSKARAQKNAPSQRQRYSMFLFEIMWLSLAVLLSTVSAAESVLLEFGKRGPVPNWIGTEQIHTCNYKKSESTFIEMNTYSWFPTWDIPQIYYTFKKFIQLFKKFLQTLRMYSSTLFKTFPKTLSIVKMSIFWFRILIH